MTEAQGYGVAFFGETFALSWSMPEMAHGPVSGEMNVLLLIRVGAIWVAVLIVCEIDPRSPGCLFTHDSVP